MVIGACAGQSNVYLLMPVSLYHAGKKPAAPFGKVSGSSSPFGAPGKAKASSAAKPFSGAGNQNLFKEMDNLSPYMQPDQMDQKPWWQNISLGQVVGHSAFAHVMVTLTHTCVTT